MSETNYPRFAEITCEDDVEKHLGYLPHWRDLVPVAYPAFLVVGVNDCDGYFYAEDFAPVLAALNAAPAWVPVEVRLPEIDEWVDVFRDQASEVPQMGIRLSVSWPRNTTLWCDFNLKPLAGVSHWRERPAPPAIDDTTGGAQ